MTATRPDSLSVYTALVLEHEGRYLLLQRAMTRHFAPGQWTGVGGLVEPDELRTLRAACLRELREETGFHAEDVANLALRRVLLHARDELTVLLYWTGRLTHYALPGCAEGTLAWIEAEHLSALPCIDTAHIVIPLLIEDHERDPQGTEALRLGVARHVAGKLQQLVWA